MKILFISAFDATFIQDDFEILKKHFSVRKQIGSGLSAIIKIIFLALTADVIYCWFASVYSFVGAVMAKLLGLRSLIVIGGVDTEKDEELQYGIWLRPWKAKLVRWAITHANYVLIGDQHLKEKIIHLARYSGENIFYLPPGFDPLFWKPLGEKEPVVLTVASVNDGKRIKIKGIDILFEAAQHLPNVAFWVIGVKPELALTRRPPLNITFYPSMARKNLLPFYQHAKVYCQPSLHESVCYTLREAMLCGCVPVVTNVGGMPNAVADIGFLVSPNNVEELSSAINQALKMPDEIGSKARMRAVALFPIQKRESELVRIIKEQEN